MSESDPIRYAGEDRVPEWVPRACVRCPYHIWATFFRGLHEDGGAVADAIDETLVKECPGAWPEERVSHGIKLPDAYTCQHPGVLDGSLVPALDGYFREGMIVMAAQQAVRAAEWVREEGSGQ